MVKFLFTFLAIFVIVDVIAAFLCFYFIIVRGKGKKKPLVNQEPSQDRVLVEYDKSVTWFKLQNWEQVEIESEDGLTLRGIYLRAKTQSNKFVIGIHGYRSSAEKEYMTYARFYHNLGFNILLPDNRAHGRSEGTYIGFGWLDRLDCILWIKYLIQRFGKDTQIMLHGISMGASTALMVSGEKIPAQVQLIVADCGFTSAWDEFAYEMKEVYHLPVFPLLYTMDIICKLLANYGLKEASALKQVAHSITPTLFIHGDQDNFVPTKMVFELYKACSAPKELLVVKGAKHAQSYLYETDKYRATIEAFIKKYM